ncbi:MAG: VWA domain-containing protein [Acidobacteriota bacterium]|nr:VWA domain-containing protein [Acidobacteriota bacterium]
MSTHALARSGRATARRRLAALALVLGAAAIVAAQPPQDPGEPPGRPALSASTSLVVLPVTVLGAHDRVVPGLTKDDFAVYDNGVRQPIQFFGDSDTPVTAGLVIDSSGSMQTKLPDVISAATAFVRTSNPRDQIFIVYFNERVSMGLPPGTPFTSGTAELQQALNAVSARGMTALYDALVAALRHLREGAHQRKVLLVISDGGDDASRTTRREAVAAAEQANVTIYTLGLFDRNDDDRDPGVLKQLARATGGEAFFPRQTSDAAEVCTQIARTIRSGYTLGYTPTGVDNAGERHTIQVVLLGAAAGRGYRVVTRSGYLTGPARW